MTELAKAYSKTSVRRLVEICAHYLYGDLKKTLITGTGLVFLISMLVWSLVYRLAIFDELTALELTHTLLLQQLEDRTYELNQIDSISLGQHLEQADVRVFPGFPSVASWLTDLSRATEKRHYQFSYQLGDGRTSHLEGVLEVPVTFTLKRAQLLADNSFEQTMNLLGSLHAEQWHLDVIGTQAKGTGSGMSEMTVESLIWVRDIQGIGNIPSAFPTLAGADPAFGGDILEEIIQ